MLDYEHFEKCINAILFLNGVEINENRSKTLYGLIKNDFDNESFSLMCKDICTKEDLYGKYPIPKMFYDRKDGGDKEVFVCIDSGAIDISDEANRAMSRMTEQQYQRMISWMRYNIDGKTMKKSSLSNVVLGFCESKPNEIEKEEYVGLTEIKKLLANHYKEEEE